MKRIFRALRTDPLYRNSIFLMLSTGIQALFGFIFWSIAANMYSASEIGVASSLISAIGLVTMFSTLGFGISLIHFLPKTKKKERNAMVWSSYWLSTSFCIILSLLFLLVIKGLYPDLAFVQSSLAYALAFVVAAVLSVFFNLVDAVFIADRETKQVLSKNLIWSVFKVLGLFALLAFSSYGIFLAWYGSMILVVVPFVFFFRISLYWGIRGDILKKMLCYSGANYIANVFVMLPAFGLPLFVMYFLGVEFTAYFYIPWMIATLLFFVPRAVGKSFLSEGSRKNSKHSLRKALTFTYAVTLLGLVLGGVASTILLSIFGESYLENSLPLLLVLLFSSLFYSYNYVKMMWYNVQHKLKAVVAINASITIATFVLSYFLLAWGILGIGVAWLIANAAVFLILMLRRFFE